MEWLTIEHWFQYQIVYIIWILHSFFLSFFLHPHMHEYSKQTQKLVTCSSSKSNRKIVQFTHAFDSFRHNHSIPFHFFSFFPLHYLSVFVFSIQYLLFKIFRFILFFSLCVWQSMRWYILFTFLFFAHHWIVNCIVFASLSFVSLFELVKLIAIWIRFNGL